MRMLLMNTTPILGEGAADSEGADSPEEDGCLECTDEEAASESEDGAAGEDGATLGTAGEPDSDGASPGGEGPVDGNM